MIAAQGKNEYLVGPELSLTSDHLARETPAQSRGPVVFTSDIAVHRLTFFANLR